MINLFRTMRRPQGGKHKLPIFTIKTSNKKIIYDGALKKPVFSCQIKFIIRLRSTGNAYNTLRTSPFPATFVLV